MKKTILKIVAIATIILSCCFVPSISFFSGKKANALSAINEDTMRINFFSTNEVDSFGNLIPDNAGKITVGVSIVKRSDGVSFTIMTRDKSAIGAQDGEDRSDADYKSKSQNIHLVTSDSNGATQYFSVQTYQTNATNLIQKGLNNDYGLTRVFEITICNIKTDSNCSYKIVNSWDNDATSKTSFDCRVLTQYDYEYSGKDGKDGYYFTDYLNGSSFSSIWIDRNNIYSQTPSGWIGINVDNDTSYSFNKSFSRFISSDYIAKYRKEDWADIYYGGSANIYESGWCTIDTPAKLALLGSDGQTIFYSEYYDPKSSGAPILFGETKFAGNNSSDYRYKLTNAAKSWLNNNTGYSIINTEDPMYNHSYCYYTQKNYGFPTAGKVYKNNSDSLTLSISRDSTWKMVFQYLRIDSELYDNNSPKIKGTYFNEVTSTDNKVMRISVRFSEPVHLPVSIQKDSLIITGYANNNGRTPLNFVYSGGEGSDTLYFDCDLKNYESNVTYTSTPITSVVFRDYNAFNSACKNISDYAYNFNQSNNYADLTFDTVSYSTNIDLRDPKVEAKLATDDNYLITSKNHTVNITVTNMVSSGSKLYYTWVKAADVQGSPETYVVESYDNCESTSPTYVPADGEKLDGEYYLYYKALSAYGKETLGYYKYKLSFDNTPVKIVNYSFGSSNATVKSRKLELTFEGKVTDLSSVLMVYRCVGFTEQNTLSIYDSAASSSAMSAPVYDETTDTSVSSIDITGAMLGLSDGENSRFCFSFIVEDSATNQSVFSIDESYLFDTSDRCKINVNIEGTVFDVYDKINIDNTFTTINGSQSFYCNSYYADGFKLTFSLLDGSSSTLSVGSMYKGSENITADLSNYFDCVIDGSTLSLSYILKQGGFYSIQLVSEEQASEVFSFYLAGNSDHVSMYEKITTDKLVVNKLFVVSDVNYYWLSGNNTVATTESYNLAKKNLSLVFSSKERAREYYRFMEMQDLSLLYLDSTNEGVTSIVANLNNNGATTMYRKAKGETTLATTGQTWIRYKNSTWNQSSDSAEWVYYFYSYAQETEISTSTLSSNLLSAIDSVVEKILSKGEYLYLTSDSGLDANYIPQIDNSRICFKTSVICTKTGVPYKNPLNFLGDNEIYSQFYTDSDGATYPIAVQKLTTSDYSSVYFTKHNGTSYEEINISGEFCLKNVIKGTGIFDIVERDENGARKYSVYIDNTAPTLNIAYDNNNEDGIQTATINSSYVGAGLTLNTKAFSFDSLIDSDEYAYVAVFSSGKKLKNTYLSNEITGVSLSEGRYIIEVYDRSGNGYSFSLRVSTEDLAKSCSISNEKNNRVRFTCSYSKDDIYRFEIYLDNVLLTEYNKNSLDANNGVTLREGGTYRFYIEDIFGNVYDETSVLIREIPQVTWYYEQDNFFVKYDEDNPDQHGLIKTKLGSTSYMITSSTKVRFNYSAACTYQVVYGNYTSASTSRLVTFSDIGNWQVKVYYNDFPDVFVTFTGKSDTSAPTISATTNRASYYYADEDDDALDEYFNSILATAKVGDIVNFPDVSFGQNDIVKEIISTGEVVSGSLVCISVSDLSGLYKWSYSHNGEITDYTDNFPENVYFSKVGKYFITATDLLGNTSNFSFEIGKTDYTDLSVDGITSSLSSVNYGNTNLVATLDGAGYFVALIDGEYFKLKTDGTNLVRVITKISAIVDNQIETEEIEEVWFDAGYLPSSSTTIIETQSYSIKTYIVGETIHLEFWLNTQSENSLDIKIRVQSDECSNSKYTEAKLSNKLSYLDYECGDLSGKLNKTLYVNSDCTIKYNEDITSYFVWFSYTGDDFYNSDFDIFPFDGVNDKICDKEGFYLIQAYNRYGNMSSVKVLYSKSIAVIGGVEFVDGEKVVYSSNYIGEYYSNYSVSFTVYTEVSYTVTKNGEDYRASLDISTDATIIKLSGNGDYIVKIIDTYGNVATKYAHIDNTQLLYSESWLDGFNSNALRKDDGYTNTVVTFSNTLKDSVDYVAYSYNGVVKKLYDKLSEEQTCFNYNAVIGVDGDGTYDVIFRDRYGNKATKKVVYKKDSPLTVSRITRSMERESYSITDAVLAAGIWSNKTINFSCSAGIYKFTVNQEERDIPYSIDFPSESERGKFVYNINYIDEYGFSYSFRCVLYRAPVEVDQSAMTVENGITKDAVSLSFSDEYDAQISINGELLGKYNSGDKYLRDGNYVFSVYDKAGNITRYAVKRDSVVSYCLYTSTKDNAMASGEVTNESVVYLAPQNNDSLSYCMVCLNGVEQVGYDSFSFNENGKWELIVKDEIGNMDYFSFYIVTHSLLVFDYTTPYGYIVTEATYNGGGGKVDCIESITTESNQSSFKFDQTGSYEIVMTSLLTGKTASFAITIDKTVPQIELDGVEAGQSTQNDVKISGYKTGDTIYIYKDGKLMKTIKVVSSADVPQITEKGTYKIVVVNEAGGSSEVEFTRLYTANVATSSLIIVIIVAIVIGLFAGLLFRKHSRIE